MTAEEIVNRYTVSRVDQDAFAAESQRSARLLTTLVHAPQARGGGRGAASLCVGGGMDTAMVVEVA